MNELIYVPRKIYFVKVTGEFILDTGESLGTNIRKTTADEDFEMYPELQKYNREALDYVELEIGQHKEDFNNCVSFRVNPETLALEFSFKEDTSTDKPIYQKPLIEQIEELQQEKILDQQRIADLELMLAEIIVTKEG